MAKGTALSQMRKMRNKLGVVLGVGELVDETLN